MFAAFGGARWWPLNSQVAVLRADPVRLLDAVFDRNRRLVRGCYENVDTAVAARAPYPYSIGNTEFLVATADGSTAVLSSGAPSIHPASALIDYVAAWLPCDGVAVDWTPRHRAGLAGSGFRDFHFTPPPPPTPGPSKTDELTLQVSDQGGGWVFIRIPPGPGHPPRSYEDHESYAARIKANRLPLELLGRYLGAVGIPVDDPGYLTGPVYTVGPETGIAAERYWSTMADLRAAAGYPPSGIPTDLRAKPALDNKV